MLNNRRVMNRQYNHTYTGHEALLSHFAHSGKLVTLELMDGTTVRGYVKTFDNFTISMVLGEEPNSYPKIYFKHAIKCFYSADLDA